MIRAIVACLIVLIAHVAHAQQASATGQELDVANRIADAASERPLDLVEVLTSIDRHQPQIMASQAKLEAARAKTQAAQGAFDPQLSSRTKRLAGGYYDTIRTDTELRQATPFWGMSIFAGHRVGLGLDPGQRFPSYYSDETLSGGEVRVGVRIPVWRDGPIDKNRASVRRARRSTDAAASALADTRFALRVAGAAAYYRWAAVGHRMLIVEQQLQLAQQRNEQLRARRAAGFASEFDVNDNWQMVLSREEELIAVRREFEATAFELSLFFRSQTGNPIVPGLDRRPALARSFDSLDISEATLIDRLLDCHPRLQQLRAEIEALQVDLDLAQNRLAPQLDIVLEVAHDIGDPDRDRTLDGTVFTAGVEFSMPLFMRTARGEVAAAREALREKASELRLAEDRLQMAVGNARSRLSAAIERTSVSARVVQTSEGLADGERRRLESGAGTLLQVNIREQNAAAGAYRYVSALAEAHIADFEWRALYEVCSSFSSTDH